MNGFLKLISGFFKMFKDECYGRRKQFPKLDICSRCFNLSANCLAPKTEQKSLIHINSVIFLTCPPLSSGLKWP